MFPVAGRMRLQGTILRRKPKHLLSCRMAFIDRIVLHHIWYTLLLEVFSCTPSVWTSVHHSYSQAATMSTRTSTRTSTVKSTQRALQKSQQSPKPFNKRPAKSDHAQATPTKVRKLSRSDTAPRRVSVDTSAKILASALKRRQQSLALGSESSPCGSTI